MSTDETKVLIGGRRFRKVSQTKVFVENEDKPQGLLRQRHAATKFATSTPENKVLYPPSYRNPNYLTLTPPPKVLDTQFTHNDSGYYGTFNSPENRSFGNFPASPPDVASKSSLWETVSSPVSSIKNKFGGSRGRANFFDDEISQRWSMQPQKVLSCLVFVTIFSCMGFALMISLKHFGGVGEGSIFSNGKYQSLQYATKKINSVDHDESAPNPNEFEESSEPKKEDPLVGIANEKKIGDDETVDLNVLVNSVDEPVLVDENVADLSEELLTQRPLPRIIVEHPVPTQSSIRRRAQRNKKEPEKPKPTENIMKTVVSDVVSIPFRPEWIEDAQDAPSVPADEVSAPPILTENISAPPVPAEVEKAAPVPAEEEKAAPVPAEEEKAAPVPAEEVPIPVTVSAEEPACCPHKPKENKSEENIDTTSNSREEDISQSRSKKKSKHVNPLTKSVKVNKVSKVKASVKADEELRSIEDEDYPDLPTFRGVKQVESQEETEVIENMPAGKLEDGTDELDYPDDPSNFR
eukprot:GFUD01012231.1.p1 GENE.GFUD01012231.1~~GFUD01012231.1.p1  ORF type:complete len:522 (+),score=148.19 GFUD01012231.1:46-1611(+)